MHVPCKCHWGTKEKFRYFRKSHRIVQKLSLCITDKSVSALTNEPSLEETTILQLRKQRRRSASQGKIAKFTHCLLTSFEILFTNPRVENIQGKKIFLNSVLRPFQDYFSSYETDQIGRWGKNGEPQEKPPGTPASRTWSACLTCGQCGARTHTRYSGEMIRVKITFMIIQSDRYY